jgi:hypothetical protein
MKTIPSGGGRIASLAGLAAMAVLLNACQEPGSTGQSPAYSQKQQVGDDPAYWEKQRCCRGGSGRNSGGGLR